MVAMKLILFYSIVIMVGFTVSGKENTGDNNWVVIANTSPFWFNYRHLANALTIYRVVKRLGIPDSRIVLMNSLEIAHDPRNPQRGKVFITDSADVNADAWNDAVVDMRGRDVSSNSFLQVLAGRSPLDKMLARPILDSDENSNVLVYLTGHGGDEFLKFHDADELTASNIAHVFDEMHLKKRYKELIFMIDTCQAATMGTHIVAPNITFIASSLKGANSYGFSRNPAVLGVSVIDRFTYLLGQYFNENFPHFFTDHDEAGVAAAKKASKMTAKQINTLIRQSTLQDLFEYFKPSFLRSVPHMSKTEGTRDAASINLLDFFGSRQFLCEQLLRYSNFTQSQQRQLLECRKPLRKIKRDEEEEEDFQYVFDVHRNLLMSVPTMTSAY